MQLSATERADRVRDAVRRLENHLQLQITLATDEYHAALKIAEEAAAKRNTPAPLPAVESPPKKISQGDPGVCLKGEGQVSLVLLVHGKCPQWRVSCQFRVVRTEALNLDWLSDSRHCRGCRAR